MEIIRTVTLRDQSKASVFWDDGWEGYGWETEAAGANGPFNSVEEAVEALMEECEGMLQEREARKLAELRSED